MLLESRSDAVGREESYYGGLGPIDFNEPEIEYLPSTPFDDRLSNCEPWIREQRELDIPTTVGGPSQCRQVSPDHRDRDHLVEMADFLLGDDGNIAADDSDLAMFHEPRALTPSPETTGTNTFSHLCQSRQSDHSEVSPGAVAGGVAPVNDLMSTAEVNEAGKRPRQNVCIAADAPISNGSGVRVTSGGSACEECHAAKTKCDRRAPTCSRCWTKGFRCTPRVRMSKKFRRSSFDYPLPGSQPTYGKPPPPYRVPWSSMGDQASKENVAPTPVMQPPLSVGMHLSAVRPFAKRQACMYPPPQHMMPPTAPGYIPTTTPSLFLPPSAPTPPAPAPGPAVVALRKALVLRPNNSQKASAVPNERVIRKCDGRQGSTGGRGGGGGKTDPVLRAHALLLDTYFRLVTACTPLDPSTRASVLKAAHLHARYAVKSKNATLLKGVDLLAQQVGESLSSLRQHIVEQDKYWRGGCITPGTPPGGNHGVSQQRRNSALSRTRHLRDRLRAAVRCQTSPPLSSSSVEGGVVFVSEWLGQSVTRLSSMATRILGGDARLYPVAPTASSVSAPSHLMVEEEGGGGGAGKGTGKDSGPATSSLTVGGGVVELFCRLVHPDDLPAFLRCKPLALMRAGRRNRGEGDGVNMDVDAGRTKCCGADGGGAVGGEERCDVVRCEHVINCVDSNGASFVAEVNVALAAEGGWREAVISFTPLSGLWSKCNSNPLAALL